MSSSLQHRAEAAMPGGVNSPVRAFRSVGGNPIYVRKGHAAWLETVDGRILTDFCLSFGPLILGHSHPDVVEAICRAASYGTSYAVTSEPEIELCELLRDAIPSMERVRLVSSGTEACMSAIRLARGFTGRNKILKFSGCYHGHTDSMLVQAGSGVAGIASASSAGVPPGCTQDTLVARYNHREDVEAILREHGSQLAAIIVEPVAANVGLMMPEPGFLEFLRERTQAVGALLIFDEVINGFRFTFGGYQNLCDIRPDLTCLGKIIGGGLPVGALGGRQDIMERLAPLGDVYQAGTLSGNPVSVAAGLATLRWLQHHDPYEDLAARTACFVAGLRERAKKHGLTVCIPQFGSVFSLFFGAQAPRDFDQVLTTRKQLSPPLFRRLLDAGVYLPPSPFEVAFLSTAHDQAVLDETLTRFDKAFAGLAS
jgi:glutamate-1-semialdehyde 2,1-aminomutase